MQIATASLSHAAAPLPMRERFALDTEGMRAAARDLAVTLHPRITEAAVVSTCNRTEIYLAGPRESDPSGVMVDWLQRRMNVPRTELDEHWRLKQDQGAVRHLFRVASGLESMVVGEPQILGQIKGAARVAQDAGTLGSHLHQLFQKSFTVAKEVRSSTKVGQSSVSLGAASVRFAQRVFDDLTECRVLLVGAGEMIGLVATHFAAQSPARIDIANRTPQRGQEIAERVGGHCLPIAALSTDLHRYDIIVSCTASQLPIIGLGAMRAAVSARRRRPMVVIDLAVPRDVEPEVGRLDGVFLHTVDDLGRMLAAGAGERQHAIGAAASIVERHTHDFMRWIEHRREVPLAQQLSERVEALKGAEVERALRALQRGDDAQSVLRGLANALSAKFTHAPYAMLRGDENSRAAVGEVLRYLQPRRAA